MTTTSPVDPVREALDEKLRERLTAILADGLRLTYHCTRVWDAWDVGTMSQDDFEPVDESDTPAELANAVLAALASHTTEPSRLLQDEPHADRLSKALAGKPDARLHAREAAAED